MVAIVKLPDGTKINVSVRALRKRLAASSPLLVLLQQTQEEVRAIEVDSSVPRPGSLEVDLLS